MGEDTGDARFLSNVLDHLPVGIWVGSANGALYRNRGFDALCGPTTEGCPPTDLVTRAIEEQAGGTADELIVGSANGSDRWIRFVATPCVEAGAQCRYAVVTCIDVTPEHEAHDESVEARTRLEVAIQNAPVVLWTVDKNGIITLSTGAALVRLGSTSEQLVGRCVFELYAGHPTIDTDIRRALAGESFSYKTAVPNVTFETWIAPIRDPKTNAVTGAIAVSTDITEREFLQAQSIRNDRVSALGSLAASVAHEVNNPLTYAILSMQTAQLSVAALEKGLASGTMGAAEMRSQLSTLAPAIETIHDGLQRIAMVTSALRTFARADDDEKLLDVRDVIKPVLRLVSKELEARARVTTSLDDVPPVRASDARLGQVFLNILLNAIQALDEGRKNNEVSVATCVSAHDVVVTISDNGPGVPPALRDQIFEPFVTNKPNAGTGLGLFVCRNIVNSLGGEITVEDRPGGGAVFRVRLPASKPVAAETAPGSPARIQSTQPPARAGRIVVIDDDLVVASTLAGVLGRAGHTVDFTEDGRRGIEMILSEPGCSLCFCDLMMPGVTGMEVFEEVKRRAPGLERRIVFMTGGAFTPTARRFAESMRHVVIEKPFDIVEEAAQRIEALDG